MSIHLTFHIDALHLGFTPIVVQDIHLDIFFRVFVCLSVCVYNLVCPLTVLILLIQFLSQDSQ